MKMVTLHGLARETRGAGMVSVVVAFLVLMIVMTLFMQSVKMSGRMLEKAQEIRGEAYALAENYYLNADQAAQTATTSVFRLNGSAVFQLDMTLKTFQDENGTFLFFEDDGRTESGGGTP